MLRSIAELAAYGTLAALLTAASLAPDKADTASSATTSSAATNNSTPIVEQLRAAGAERGALLFAVKGCVGCHTHSAFPNARMEVGPDLTGLAARAGSRVAGLNASGYVRQSLRDPGAYRATAGYAVMPDLGLTDEQVESLTAFLLSSSR